jgi:hypothetical protein
MVAGGCKVKKVGAGSDGTNCKWHVLCLAIRFSYVSIIWWSPSTLDQRNAIVCTYPSFPSLIDALFVYFTLCVEYAEELQTSPPAFFFNSCELKIDERVHPGLQKRKQQTQL